jgi:hypothetical protein
VVGGIVALVAQAERDAPGRRCHPKSRYVRLSSPNGAASLRRAGKRRPAASGGDRFNSDAEARPGARDGGHPPWRGDELRAIAAETERPWGAHSARRTLARLDRDELLVRSQGGGCHRLSQCRQSRPRGAMMSLERQDADHSGRGGRARAPTPGCRRYNSMLILKLARTCCIPRQRSSCRRRTHRGSRPQRRCR